MPKTRIHPETLQIKDFSYELPEGKIARYPLDSRDASKLLIFRKGISEDIYRNLSQYLPEQSLLVFNQTRVVNARLIFQKETGGKIEVFCLEPDERYADVPVAMQQKGLVYWKCLVGGAAKWKEGQVLALADLESDAKVYAAMEERREGYFLLKIYWDSAASFAEILQRSGAIPLPPYLNREAEEADKDRYQTIFAKEEGSVAAPTASLHFTPGILDSLSRKNIDTTKLTLHVGAGTFKPVKSETMQQHDMHAEWVEISRPTIERLLQQVHKGKPIIATGTTTARSLESLYWIGVRILRNEPLQLHEVAVPQWYPYQDGEEPATAKALEAVLDFLEQAGMEKLITRTQIIIAPGYTFKLIQALITNFHQPQSTLLLLVAAIAGDAWQDIYAYALNHDFRFLSYGDGSLLWIS